VTQPGTGAWVPVDGPEPPLPVASSDWRRVAARKEIDGVVIGAYKGLALRVIEHERVVS
jgi:hypothetical protein